MRLLKYVPLLFLAGAGWNAAAALPVVPAPREPLVWECENLTNHAKAGDISSHFTFTARNVSGADVFIDDTKTSCGCTVAQLPSKPWRLAPNESGKLEVLVDLRGKHGAIFKDVSVISSNAAKLLNVTVEIADGTNTMSKEMADRLWGQQLAGIDHQAVFKTTCVKCHLEPAFGKSGGELYLVACGICHEAKHRATMVPDLHALKTEITPDYWRTWVTNGKPGSLMPGFAATLGGPLDDAQVDSLVKFLIDTFPRPLKPAAK